MVFGGVLMIGSAVAVAGGGLDFGLVRDGELAIASNHLFGVKRPVPASSTQSISQAEALADPTKLATLAKGLQAHVVTTQGPAVDDQISLWPNEQEPQVPDRLQRDRTPPTPGWSGSSWRPAT